jgi:hypothetical protein
MTLVTSRVAGRRLSLPATRLKQQFSLQGFSTAFSAVRIMPGIRGGFCVPEKMKGCEHVELNETIRDHRD